MMGTSVEPIRFFTDHKHINPFMPTVAFNICCPRDCVSRHNGGTAGAPLTPLRDDSALRAQSTLRGLRRVERRSLSDRKFERNGGHKWVKVDPQLGLPLRREADSLLCNIPKSGCARNRIIPPTKLKYIAKKFVSKNKIN